MTQWWYTAIQLSCLHAIYSRQIIHNDRTQKILKGSFHQEVTVCSATTIPSKIYFREPKCLSSSTLPAFINRALRY
ncbi:uncharacterized protein EV154DRAFT_272541 [Mucor mucedo]|uniref:uncharacterized protein n=1 Tax=Mucor mucedo TaxID=29922 RepID=UPI0022206F0C|nr:uncharacterized protein EV154DRAFT_272541 [Mucor mucedo]KAI7889719.1 hypothetical protein EV154DRAFT_272541 [Mucor mucedo]